MELQQCLIKRKKPSHPFAQGAVVMGSASGSCRSHRGGVFGLSSPEPPAPRDGRKRRKDKLTWVKHTLTPYFDGHLWRKYGQKVIKDAPYPRLYFRCSYREDRQCLASKLVQQVNHDDPPLYEVTYMHEHSCNAAPVPPPNVVANAMPPPPETSGAALVLRFGSSGGGGGGGSNHHHGAGMPPQEMKPYPYHQLHVLHPSPFLMMNSFDDSNGSQPHAFFPPHVLPPVAESSSPPFAIIESSPATPPSTSWSPSSFPIIESSPTAQPSTDNEDDLFSTLDLDSFLYDLDIHSHFSDHVHL